jgi:hypothetical protein
VEVVQEKKRKKKERRPGSVENEMLAPCPQPPPFPSYIIDASSLALNPYIVALLSPTPGTHCIYNSITLDFGPAVSQDPGRPLLDP